MCVFAKCGKLKKNVNLLHKTKLKRKRRENS